MYHLWFTFLVRMDENTFSWLTVAFYAHGCGVCCVRKDSIWHRGCNWNYFVVMLCHLSACFRFFSSLFLWEIAWWVKVIYNSFSPYLGCNEVIFAILLSSKNRFKLWLPQFLIRKFLIILLSITISNVLFLSCCLQNSLCLSILKFW